MTLNIPFMIEVFPSIIAKLPVTMALSIGSMIGGGILGMLIGLIRYYRIPVLNQLFKMYVSFIRGVPLLVQLYIIYFGVPFYINMYCQSAGIPSFTKYIPAIAYAMVAFCINTSASVSEVFRSALEAIDEGQYEACLSVGMTGKQAMLLVMLPQAMVGACPNLVNLFIGNIKASSLAYMVSVAEMMGVAINAASAAYFYFEVYILAAVIYWILC
ncbi:MAG: amino acid ABC transporter permease, partial [Firmicutes bacterium]|nr:amino acid ABC transporter permease [Bacillota bacterium]